MKDRQAKREAAVQQALTDALRLRQVEQARVFANPQPLGDIERAWLADITRRAEEKFDRENPEEAFE